jgi:hypothetical protein
MSSTRGARSLLTSIQLVAVADPSQAEFGDVVEGNEVVVSRDAMNRLDTDLL